MMALSATLLKRLPLTTSIVYLAVGFVLGPAGFGLISLDPVEHSGLLEHFTEVAVIISLFTAGLKLRIPLNDRQWRIPVRLAFVSMTITVGLIALTGVTLLGLSLGAAILLGGMLAPTDPVLASDVQVENAFDRDRLRFSLTGEASLNDGTAFPFVMLGLGLMGLHELGDFGLRWIALDVVWSTLGGLAIGGLLGTLVGKLVLYLRSRHKEALGLDDFLALGLIAFAYGSALLLHTSGFLAVFAAGFALRRIERQTTGEDEPEKVLSSTPVSDLEQAATDPKKAPAYLVSAVLLFNEQLERIGEVTVVVVVGAMLSFSFLPAASWWFIPLLFFVIRPISVALGLLGATNSSVKRRYMSWFGIRGIGSIYYLMYAIQHGIPAGLAQQFASLTLAIVAVSIVVHGISVTPLMNAYGRIMRRSRSSSAALQEEA